VLAACSRGFVRRAAGSAQVFSKVYDASLAMIYKKMQTLVQGFSSPEGKLRSQYSKLIFKQLDICIEFVVF
jgi:hypothetical protein